MKKVSLGFLRSKINKSADGRSCMGEKCYPKLSSRGQVVIPKDIRDKLNVGRGDRVKLTVERMDND